MNCTICGHPIILTPHAAERVRKFGGKATDYIRLFDQHSTCALQKRKEDVEALIVRNRTWPKRTPP